MPRRQSWRACAALLLFLGVAHASDEPALPPDSFVEGERLDNREPLPKWRDYVLEVPRLVLAPLRVTLRLLAIPARYAAAWEEKEHGFERLLAALTWKNGKIGVLPGFQWNREFRPLVGASFFHNYAFGKDTQLTASFLIGSKRDLITKVKMRPTPSSSPVEFVLTLAYQRRDDQIFGGIASMNPKGVYLPVGRFAIDMPDAISSLAYKSGPLKIGVGDDLGLRRYGDGVPYDGDPRISSVYCTEVYTHCSSNHVSDAQVPRFTEGTQFVRPRFFVELDTRKKDNLVTRTGGVFGNAEISYTNAFAGDNSRYVRATMLFGGAINLFRNTHFLVLSVKADTVAPIHGQVAFSELPTLGGPDDLRGFRLGRLRDYSTLLGTVEYRWPIWIFADLGVFTDLGGTGGIGWKGLTDQPIRPDVGVSFHLHTAGSYMIRLQLAYGFYDGLQFAFAGDLGR